MLLFLVRQAVGYCYSGSLQSSHSYAEDCTASWRILLFISSSVVLYVPICVQPIITVFQRQRSRNKVLMKTTMVFSFCYRWLEILKDF